MRTIKFRAWINEDGGYFIYPKEIIFANSGGFKINGKTTKDDFRWSHVSSLDEFTGLKDKNGTEIWEGSIVRFKWNPFFNEGSTLFEFELPVEYDSGWGCFVMRLKSKDGEEQRVAVGSPDEAQSEGGIEVIGNIYENSDLLANKEKI